MYEHHVSSWKSRLPPSLSCHMTNAVRMFTGTWVRIALVFVPGGRVYTWRHLTVPCVPTSTGHEPNILALFAFGRHEIIMGTK